MGRTHHRTRGAGGIAMANHSSGIGFCGALTVLFVGLKLTHQIAWSWVWVLSPLWMPLVLLIALIAFCELLQRWVEK